VKHTPDTEALNPLLKSFTERSPDGAQLVQEEKLLDYYMGYEDPLKPEMDNAFLPKHEFEDIPEKIRDIFKRAAPKSRGTFSRKPEGMGPEFQLPTILPEGQGPCYYGSGGRKTARARVMLTRIDGTRPTRLTINGRLLHEYFSIITHRETVLKPLVLSETFGWVDVSVRVKGGGQSGSNENQHTDTSYSHIS
jgi:hypothetical protein